MVRPVKNNGGDKPQESDDRLERPDSGQVGNAREKVRETLKTPGRLMRGLRLWKRMQVKGEIETEGMENLDLIPPGKKVIFAPTHITDGDIPAAALALGDHFKLGIVNQSVHHRLTGEPSMYLGLLLAGKGNFYPVDFEWVKRKGKKSKVGRFNPQNYLAMSKAMDEEGKAMVMAAHSPAFNSKLPGKGGFGVVFLAGLTDAVVVPVAVDFQSEHTITAETYLQNIVHRSGVKIRIGKPIDFEPIEGIEDSLELFSQEKGLLSADERAESRRILKTLTRQSNQLMRELASLLPPDKRGVWSEA